MAEIGYFQMGVNQSFGRTRRIDDYYGFLYNSISSCKHGDKHTCDTQEMSECFTSDHTRKSRIASLLPATDRFCFGSLIVLRFETIGSSSGPIAIW